MRNPSGLRKIGEAVMDDSIILTSIAYPSKCSRLEYACAADT